MQTRPRALEAAAMAAAVAVLCLLMAGGAHGDDLGYATTTPATETPATETPATETKQEPSLHSLFKHLPLWSHPGSGHWSYSYKYTSSSSSKKPSEPAPETTTEPAPATEQPSEPAPETTTEPAPETTKPADDFYTQKPEPETPASPEPETPSEPAPEQPTEPAPETMTPADDFYTKKPEPETPAAGGYSGGGGGKSLDDDGEPTDGLSPKAIANILKEHNVFRAKEHVPPLKWNATVAGYAQKYANSRKGDCALEHSTGPYGENLMYGQGKAWTWRHTVDEWSDEKRSYHYGSNTCDRGKMCGHYTAVVWKHTTDVGCGRVTCTSGDTLMVCSYYPPGNYVGEKPY